MTKETRSQIVIKKAQRRTLMTENGRRTALLTIRTSLFILGKVVDARRKSMPLLGTVTERCTNLKDTLLLPPLTETGIEARRDTLPLTPVVVAVIEKYAIIGDILPLPQTETGRESHTLRDTLHLLLQTETGRESHTQGDILPLTPVAVIGSIIIRDALPLHLTETRRESHTPGDTPPPVNTAPVARKIAATESALPQTIESVLPQSIILPVTTTGVAVAAVTSHPKLRPSLA